LRFSHGMNLSIRNLPGKWVEDLLLCHITWIWTAWPESKADNEFYREQAGCSLLQLLLFPDTKPNIFIVLRNSLNSMDKYHISVNWATGEIHSDLV
jgi:hypothetical protein